MPADTLAATSPATTQPHTYPVAVAKVYRAWETRAKLSRIVTLEELRAADYNLSPSQFVEVADRVEHRPLGEIMADLAVARGEREQADAALAEALARLGLDG